MNHHHRDSSIRVFGFFANSCKYSKYVCSGYSFSCRGRPFKFSYYTGFNANFKLTSLKLFLILHISNSLRWQVLVTKAMSTRFFLERMRRSSFSKNFVSAWLLQNVCMSTTPWRNIYKNTWLRLWFPGRARAAIPGCQHMMGVDWRWQPKRSPGGALDTLKSICCCSTEYLSCQLHAFLQLNDNVEPEAAIPTCFLCQNVSQVDPPRTRRFLSENMRGKYSMVLV